jgi:hypothetical protein
MHNFRNGICGSTVVKQSPYPSQGSGIESRRREKMKEIMSNSSIHRPNKCYGISYNHLLKNCTSLVAVLRALFKTLNFICKLNGPNKSACPWQAFLAWCNVTLYLIGPIRKLRRKSSVVYTIPGLQIKGQLFSCQLRHTEKFKTFN